MTSLKKYTIPFILFFLSLLLRLHLISKGPFHLDCLNLAINAEKTLDTFQLHYLFGPGYPLTVILGSFFIFLTRLFSIDDPVFSVNLMSVVLSALSIPLFYFIAKKLSDPFSALLGAVTFSISPIFLGLSVYGKSHTPSLFLLFLCILCLIYYFENRNKRLLLWGSIFFGLMGAARVQDMILMIIPLASLFLLLKKDKIHWKHLLQFFAIAFVIAALFHAPYLLTKSRNLFYGQFSTFWESGLKQNFMGFLSPILFISLTYLTETTTLVGLIFSCLGFIILFKTNYKLSLFLLLWTIVPLLFYGNLITSAPRFLAIILPPLFIAQGMFYKKMTEFSFFTKLPAYVCYLAIFLYLFSSAHPILYIRNQNAILPEFVRWVTDSTEENAKIIITDNSKFYSYYGNRAVLGRPLAYTIKEHMLDDFKKSVDENLESNIPVYITALSLSSYDLEHKFSNFVKEHYNLNYVGEQISEGWYKGAYHNLIYTNNLYRLTKK